MPIFHCSAILFDLDGVLVDSTRSVERHWRAWAQQNGVDADKIMAIAHGVRAIEVIKRVAPHLDAAAEVREIEAREVTDREGVVPMPGAAALVASVPEGQWGVVTSGTRLLAGGRLRLMGLPVPKVLVTADDVANGKPHPEPYLKGAELLGVSPGECLVIEDAPAGIQAARAGGMKVVGITSTYPAKTLGHADAVIEKLAAIHVSPNGAGKLTVTIR
jgi:mannitol-1-/sugar-/sorbitol-6-phosphatase